MADCRVFFTDHKGIEHGIRLEAENRYVAFGLAMDRFRQSNCCAFDCNDIHKLNVHVLEGFRVKYRIVVTREHFEQWLGPPIPLDRNRMRRYLQMLLGRMEPDRDFKRSLSDR